MEQNYKLSDYTPEELKAFVKDFDEVLKKHSAYIEPTPQYQRRAVGEPWGIGASLLIQKKTIIEKDVEPKAETKDETTKED